MKNRNIYLNILLEHKDKDVIKIITGIRRCGKSTLLKLFVEKLLETGILKENIVQMNFESLEYDDIKEYKTLFNRIKKQINPDKKTYIILDEVQIVQNWEKAVNSLIVDFDVDVYITGSNAFLLSSELSTLLSGRYVEIKMLPLSFQEFLDFNDFKEDVEMESRFELYLKYGGMPVISEYNFNQQRINEILEGIYHTVILKDVTERNKITDTALLKKVVLFLADNIGNITSVNNISNYLVNEKRMDKNSPKSSFAHKTIDNYINALENAFIFYSVKRYDIKGKAYLKTLSKHYITDIGIRNMLLGYRDVDRGHILENIVFLELLRRGYSVSIGKIGEKEIDFIATKPEEKIYYQVTENMSGEETRKREIAPLQAVDDNYKKVILSMDKSFISSFEGIEVVNIIDFLLQG